MTELAGAPVPPVQVSTGQLPDTSGVQAAVEATYHRHLPNVDGEVASYIPVLARASAELFGIAMVAADGREVGVGDTEVEFSIQSVSKPFVFALVRDALGSGQARSLLGVNATGFPFNSVVAMEVNEGRTMNPMVNAGAMAATSLVPGDSAEEKWSLLQRTMSRFAGRDLAVDEEVFESESATNQRNLGIAHLLRGYGRIYADPGLATEVYTRQCSLAVTAHDLAVMAATFANGGVNPITRERVVSADTARHTLAVLATAGLYERSGDWLYDVGLPGKSGVSGGVITIAPGKGGLAIYSPPLDPAGNSVRGVLATRDLSSHLGLDVFASAEVAPVR
jgi:glutaminase